MLPPIEPGTENDGRIGRLGRQENFFECEICKSKIFWIPRKSTHKKCWQCSPPSTRSIVAITNADDQHGPDVGATDPKTSTVPKPCAWTVLYERPVCPYCYSSHIDEIWNEDGMRMRCSCCKKQIAGEHEFLQKFETRKNSMYALTQDTRLKKSEKKDVLTSQD